jgi:hypothetical protein
MVPGHGYNPFEIAPDSLPDGHELLGQTLSQGGLIVDMGAQEFSPEYNQDLYVNDYHETDGQGLK